MKLKSIGESVTANISNHHIHLSEEDLFCLFGKGYKLNNLKNLLQPGQYACKEKVNIVGPKNVINKVRIIGPLRKKTQIEISRTEGFYLGINPPLRDSGALEGSAKIGIIGPKGKIEAKACCIIVRRHIHMKAEEAKQYKVKDKEIVNVKVKGERGLIFGNVQVRVRKDFALECHIDMDEANACGLKNGQKVQIVNFTEE
ncbi:phosphate propanoyltransferase [bacterium]|nr:phosphate propanoyltransferase [bacterium]